ncbi:E2 domain-containing protein [Pseudomonas aeruginosa]|uniref:E2 domain-containing protein n=1 Tax=Pseudomonas aeruginosa TaxID=287 RepID=UPI003A4C7249
MAFPQTATLDLPIRLVDGRTLPAKPHLRQDGEWIEARESTPHHLPGFCPERHINSRWYVLSVLRGLHPLPVSDEPSARAWLETIYKYLKLQERARTCADGRMVPRGHTATQLDINCERRRLRAQSVAKSLTILR